MKKIQELLSTAAAFLLARYLRRQAVALSVDKGEVRNKAEPLSTKPVESQLETGSKPQDQHSQNSPPSFDKVENETEEIESK